MRAPKTNPQLAVAYLRISTTAERQALGLEAQRQAIRGWALREGVELAGEVIEEVSGGAALSDRDGLLEAIALVQTHGAGHLVVAKLDRFSRDPLTAALAEAELVRAGASLAIADGNGDGDDPTSELVRGMLLVVARFEKAMIVARIKAALAVKKSKGELTGNSPFGYMTTNGELRRGKDGTLKAVKFLVENPEEMAVISRIRALRARGLSLRRIVSDLASTGVVGRTGQPLTLPAIARILRPVVV